VSSFTAFLPETVRLIDDYYHGTLHDDVHDLLVELQRAGRAVFAQMYPTILVDIRYISRDHALCDLKFGNVK
jgi:hypothetical protein